MLIVHFLVASKDARYRDLKEKRLFIDSILHKYPTPSIIVSTFERKDENGIIKDYYEIIDGLQRLNAIVSFANNEFGVMIDNKEYYFDMLCDTFTNAEMLRGNLQPKEPKLDFNACVSFSSAEIPVIITEQREDRDRKIEQIFGRINSSGRKLSAHDIRQASSVGEFSDLVRRIATTCRGDYTYSDEINLCDMPKISLGGKGLNYGISPDDTFWRKHDIIPYSRFRQSKDEEIIASAMTTLLLGDNLKINADRLDDLYRPGNKYYDKIEEAVSKFGKTELEELAKDVIDQINNIFESVHSDFTSYLYPRRAASAKDLGFVALFCALFQLDCESYEIEDYEQIANLLRDNYQSTFCVLEQSSQHDSKIKVKNLLYSVLKNAMVKRENRKKTETEKKLEELLSLSPVEMQMVEFKIGITYFENKTINQEELGRIWKTLVAMANTNCEGDSTGYVIVGVADNPVSCKNWIKVYNETPLNYGSHKIVGITKEAVSLALSVDQYERLIGDLIKRSPISNELKSYVLSNYEIVNFRDKVLLILPSTKQESTSYCDGKYYVREGSKTKHVPEKDQQSTHSGGTARTKGLNVF